MSVDDAGKPVQAPDAASLLLRDLVHARIGMYFDTDRMGLLVEKLQPLAQKFRCLSLLDFYYRLKYEEGGAEDWTQVADELSVQETYFWREMSQIQALTDHLVPEWFKKRSDPLMIWSAACATGEEPYTIVMALLETGCGQYPIEIHGSDASISALEKARKAVYREKSFRALPPLLRTKYFLPAAGGWKLNPEVTQRVTFHRANIMAAEEISPLARAPMVFCRNLFIYFSPHAVRQTLAILASRMPVNGYLFVGASESLLKLTTDFELRELHGAFCYVRI